MPCVAFQTGRRVSELMVEAGVPAAVFAPIYGDGKEAGPALVAQPLDGLYFTGSSATGQKLASTLFSPEALRRRSQERPSALFPRLQLELGGKDPAYVRSDAPDPKSVRKGRRINTMCTHARMLPPKLTGLSAQPHTTHGGYSVWAAMGLPTFSPSLYTRQQHSWSMCPRWLQQP
jgi:hypothetical protein